MTWRKPDPVNLTRSFLPASRRLRCCLRRAQDAAQPPRMLVVGGSNPNLPDASSHARFYADLAEEYAVSADEDVGVHDDARRELVFAPELSRDYNIQLPFSLRLPHGSICTLEDTTQLHNAVEEYSDECSCPPPRNARFTRQGCDRCSINCSVVVKDCRGVETTLKDGHRRNRQCSHRGHAGGNSRQNRHRVRNALRHAASGIEDAPSGSR
jgi:hypothetical protein